MHKKGNYNIITVKKHYKIELCFVISVYREQFASLSVKELIKLNLRLTSLTFLSFLDALRILITIITKALNQRKGYKRSEFKINSKCKFYLLCEKLMNRLSVIK